MINKIFLFVLIFTINAAKATDIDWECTSDKTTKCLSFGKSVLKNVFGCKITDDGYCDEIFQQGKIAVRFCTASSPNCVSHEYDKDYGGRLQPCPIGYTDDFYLLGYSTIEFYFSYSNGARNPRVTGNREGLCIANSTAAAYNKH